tara:strand:+ start:658 stop:1167 length:510 start_codon:yes stop_codon:yes gene_type:complete
MKIAILLFISLLVQNCHLSITNSKLFESFYVGNGKTNYFIKSLKFKGPEKSKIFMDLTFNMAKENDNAVIINFSIINIKETITVDSMSINSDNELVSLKRLHLLFLEKNKNQFLSRYTSKIDLKEAFNLFKNSEWDVTIHLNGVKHIFKNTHKTMRKIDYLNEHLFMIL